MAGVGRTLWMALGLCAVALGCGPLEELTEVVQGPSEVVGRNRQWFLDNVGPPCSKEVSSMGGELWLYAQEAERTDLLACDTPGVQRSWGIYFMGEVCTAAKSLDRPPR